MPTATRQTHNFTGVRIQVDSTLPFDEVLNRFRSQCGRASAGAIGEIAARTSSAEEFEREVNRSLVGPSGFMIFAEFDHSPWMRAYGLNRRVLRIIFGNPLIAITMLREDISAGLFAPVELLLLYNDSGTTIQYVQPSSLIVINDNPPLLKAAQALDEKLSALISTISGL
jgi:uncharacterized protein (DUF302 family)